LSFHSTRAKTDAANLFLIGAWDFAMYPCGGSIGMKKQISALAKIFEHCKKNLCKVR